MNDTIFKKWLSSQQRKDRAIHRIKQSTGYRSALPDIKVCANCKHYLTHCYNGDCRQDIKNLFIVESTDTCDNWGAR